MQVSIRNIVQWCSHGVCSVLFYLGIIIYPCVYNNNITMKHVKLKITNNNIRCGVF